MILFSLPVLFLGGMTLYIQITIIEVLLSSQPELDQLCGVL